MKSLISRLSLLALSLLVAGSCATSRPIIDDAVSQTYTKNFETVVALFERAARKGSLYFKVLLKKPKYVVYEVNKNNSRVGQVQSTPSAVVHIKKLNSNKVLLAIQKPDYPPSLTRNLKQHYERIIFSNIEEIMEQVNQ